MSPPARPSISVVIPTRDRVDLLTQSLDSLRTQTLEPSAFEVIVVEDGVPKSEALCRRLQGSLPLRYVHTSTEGIAAAKNVGARAAQASIVLFFDDDDVADPNLLRTHIEAHQQEPDPRLAVLGWTGWSPHLATTPLMHYVTEIGKQLFCYPLFKPHELLGFDSFWGGRASCKRALFEELGGFNPSFVFGYEDIEFAFRAQRSGGFRVRYRADSKQFMIRPLGYRQMARRIRRQAQAQVLFQEILHPGGETAQYFSWSRPLVGPMTARILRVPTDSMVRVQERLLGERTDSGVAQRRLFKWYERGFAVHRSLGIWQGRSRFHSSIGARTRQPVEPLHP